MSYQQYETSSHDGRPVELLEIQFGEGPDDTIRTCNADHDLVVEGNTYLATYTERDSFNDEGTPDDQQQLNIKVARDHPFALLYLAREIPGTILVRLRAVHINDPDLGIINIWSGRLVGYSHDFPRVTFGCERIASSLQRTGCRARYQRQCRHALYMGGCRLNKDDWAVQATITSIAANRLTVSVTLLRFPIWITPPTAIVGGIFTLPNGNSRFVVKQAGSSAGRTLTLSRPLVDANLGDTVTLHPGCDRLASTCESKFDNLLNYGGFDFIPPRGPFSGSSIV